MTDTQVMAALIVTQADREAAADVLFHVDGDPFVEHIREGLEDDSYLVQAFARHRIASSPAATLPDCIVNGDVEAWLFSHPDRDGDMEAGRLELFNFRMGYAAPVTPPAVDAELREIVRPFAEVASAILAEAPADADSFALFTDCQRNTYAVSMDELRALSALATPPSVPAQQGEAE